MSGQEDCRWMVDWTHLFVKDMEDQGQSHLCQDQEQKDYKELWGGKEREKERDGLDI